MRVESIVTVSKVWGKEIILSNNEHYCGKLLCLDRNAQGSLHYHMNKTETFYVMEGHIKLTVEGREFVMNRDSEPVTILNGEKHIFRGIADSIILEVSTPHKDEDTYRIEEATKGW